MYFLAAISRKEAGEEIKEKGCQSGLFSGYGGSLTLPKLIRGV